ncbi:IgGFc-binding protein-like [Discoglossus pictus]
MTGPLEGVSREPRGLQGAEGEPQAAAGGQDAQQEGQVEILAQTLKVLFEKMGSSGILHGFFLLTLGYGLCLAGLPGTEFITVFMQNYKLSSGNPQYQLSITALNQPTNATIYVNRHSYQKKISLDAHETTTVLLPKIVQMTANESFSYSVIVLSINPIYVISINSRDESSDSTALYPFEELGTEYYVFTPPEGPPGSFKEFAVVASKEPTTVTLSLTGRVTYHDRVYGKGSTLTFSLEPFEGVELQSEDDLSGTRVQSHRPVAVLSGHTCSWKHTKCNHVYEQLQPVSNWASTYLIAPLSFQTKYDLVYVTASVNTKVTYQAGSLTTTKELYAGDGLEIQLKPSAPLYITSTEGIQVLFYCAGGRNGSISYDTYLLSVPDTASFCTSYQAITQQNFTNDAVVVAKTSSLKTLTVDKVPLKEIGWQNIPGTEYSWGEFSLGSEAKSFMFEDPDNPFGLFTVGVAPMNDYGELPVCVSGLTRPSCSHVKCRKKETCKIVKGQAVCIASSEAMCWSWGDPHYHTFDGKNYDFQGTCKYTMAKTCGSDVSLPDFNIETKNENRGSAMVSYLSSVTIQVYGYNISGFRSEYGIVRVDNQRSQLPVILHDGKLQIFQSGSSFLLITEFGLKALYDWNILLKITLPSSFAENVCGLCGNYNGNQNDDLKSLTPIAFGRTWKVEDDGTCWDDCNGECKKCSNEQKYQYSQPSICGILTNKKAQGPFRMCHKAVDPVIYKDNCVYDLCMNDGFNQILCQAVKTYSDACHREGALVYDWRNITGCSFECPPNSKYNPCGSACPATCLDFDAPSKCTEKCIETCECDEGFVLIAGKCKPKEQCGCLYDGEFIPPNGTFWGDSACKQKCKCNGDTQQVDCKEVGCKKGEECSVIDGIQDCYATRYGTCSVSGDPHYITYDGYHYTFQGTCQYKLTGLCNKDSGLTDFQVHVLNQNRGSLSVSYAAAVNVTIYSTEIQIRRDYPDQVMVDGLLSNLPLTLSNGRLSVFRSGRHCIIQSRKGIRVAYDWDARVAVTVPYSYSKSVCGLCGNFNKKAEDDLTAQNGTLMTDIVTFGKSWKVGTVPGCREIPDKVCGDLAMLEKEQRHSKEWCGLIVDKHGPFRNCHAKVPPENYFEDCVYDLCAFGKRGDISCRLLSGYTSTCQEAGAEVYPWRTDTFCNLPCSNNSHYNICTTGCPSTCLSLTSTTKCDSVCKEGCACNDGFVLSGGQCVPMSECGCTFSGQYYKPGEVFFPSGTCDQRCTCQFGGSVACSAFSCGLYEECRVEKGSQSCLPVGSAECSVMGETNYRTYDGFGYDFNGDCSYILSKTCTIDKSKPTPFLIRVKKQKPVAIGSPSSKLITLEIYNHTIDILQGSENTITVDGILHNLPFDLESGKLHASQKGLGVIVSTDFGLVISSDLSLRVTVPGTYHNQTCGLCGNYDEEPQNDLQQANGDSVTFAKSWKAPDSEETCTTNEVCVGENCLACDKAKVEILKGEKFCGILTAPDGPFAACHSTVDPSQYLNTCINTLCAETGDLCVVLESYVGICQDAGVKINSWRTPSFCAPSCPEHSHFSSCANLCATSCSTLYETIICPSVCSEGCQCDTGYFFQNGACVVPEHCGCYQDGSYYKLNQTVISGDCSQRCTCNSNQLMVCDPYGCASDENCTVNSGAVACVNVDPCKAIKCRNQESCKIQNGNPVCVPDYVGSCWEFGNNHYQTFDGYNFDFQGTCTYVLSKYIANDTSLVPFSIEEKNDDRGSQAHSFDRFLNIFVYDYKITIKKGEFGKIRVNDEIINLPLSLLDGKISAVLTGSSAVLNTDFGLEVAFNYNWNVVITIPSSYYGTTGGLCGNFNKNPSDEMSLQYNTTVSVTEWAKSWKVDEDQFCSDICQNCIKCDESKKSLYVGEQFCGLINKTDGPFAKCHAKVNPDVFFENCLYDVCNNDLCQALQTYASVCQMKGVIINWRTVSNCSPKCPENSHYEVCGSACPATCSDRTSPESCSKPCVESCQCDDGYVISVDKCVPANNCGCNYKGLYYQPNQVFWPDDKCKVRCKCDPELGMVVCNEADCKASEKCTVINGINGCHPSNYSTCIASGDPHYTTFDGKRFDFMGTCIYQFVGVCSSDPSLMPFQVKIQNEQRGKKSVSYTKALTLEVYNQSITLNKDYPQQILVNGVITSLPFSYKNNKIKAFINGEHAFVRTDFDVTVNYNWDNYARVMLPSTYANAVCGLCGNYNFNPDDDLNPTNDQESDKNKYDEMWKVGEVAGCTSGCKEKCPQCNEEQTLKYKSMEYCGILNEEHGPFSQCYKVIDPQPFFSDCVYDACQYKGYYSAVCGAIMTYVTQCQAKGISIQEWRTPTFCNATCKSNSHYELCGSGCRATCPSLSSSVDCVKSCTEGCYCDNGFILSGGECVPVSECGCVFRQKYYQKGEEFYPEGQCEEKCQCGEDGSVKCHAVTCGRHEECKVENGVYGCHPASHGSCVISGSSQFTSFDGLSYNYQGSCSYTVAEVCRGHSNLENFTIFVDNESNGKSKMAVTRFLKVHVYDYEINMERGVQWQATVNEEIHVLPFTLENGKVQIRQEGSSIILQTDFDLTVIYDTMYSAYITIPSTYSDTICGLCGDFNGQSNDDLRLPSGQLSTSVDEFGAAWSASLDRQGCTIGCQEHCDGCDVMRAAIFGRNEACGQLIIENGPFANCYGLVNASNYFDKCIFEMCASDGQAHTLCEILNAFAFACQAAGAKIDDWRTTDFCPMSCPNNSHYEPCTFACDNTCSGITKPGPCSDRCFEGCECNDGYVFDGEKCVSVDKCGCVHNGRYLNLGASLVSSDCHQKCTCETGGQVVCSDMSCSDKEFCGLQDGERSCVEKQGTCSIDRNGDLITFDKISGTLASADTFDLASICNLTYNSWFRLVVITQSCHKGVSVSAVHGYFPGVSIAINPKGEAWVNGHAVTLPTRISRSLSLSSVEGGVVVKSGSDMELQMMETGDLTIQVSQDLTGALCGACGNFNRQRFDDLQVPGGQTVNNIYDFIASWRSRDFSRCGV